MTPHKRFDHLMRRSEDSLTSIEFYTKSLLGGLYERGTVSNIPYPTLLPAWDDKEDIENIIKALDILKQDFRDLIL